MIRFVLTTVLLIPTIALTLVGQPPEDYFADDPILDDYVRRGLERNPAVLEALARYRAALQRIPQVRSLPDPMFSFTQFMRSVETRVGPQLNVFNVSQKFPWFGKLDLAGRVVFKEAAALEQLFRASERELIAEVKRSFYELSYVQRAIQISREEESLLDHYEELAQARYSQGGGQQQAVIKIQAELTRILDRIDILTRQSKSVEARLNTLVDQPPDSPVGPIREPALPQVDLDLEKLYSLGDRNRQELKAALLLVEKGEQAVELAKKQGWPDLTLSGGTVNVGDRNDLAGQLMPPPDNGKNAYSFSIGVNIPIWRGKYRAEVLEATEQLISSRHQYRDIRNEMEFTVRDQVVRLETLRQQLELYDRVLVPQAEEALRSTEAAYETGQLGMLDLLDSERFLLQVRLIRIRYNSDYLIALAELERAVGTRFP